MSFGMLWISISVSSSSRRPYQLWVRTSHYLSVPTERRTWLRQRWLHPRPVTMVSHPRWVLESLSRTGCLNPQPGSPSRWNATPARWTVPGKRCWPCLFQTSILLPAEMCGVFALLRDSESEATNWQHGALLGKCSLPWFGLRTEAAKPVVHLPRTFFEDRCSILCPRCEGWVGVGACSHMAEFISEALLPGKDCSLVFLRRHSVS